ncbi:hypothetical protein AB1Y20_004736 [Prymnesium parvum]|uniref:Uncharacterized protein n=1 Tax=Prymnesium parvum TaxID=97485 RepID=A0AB34J139_PRYPA
MARRHLGPLVSFRDVWKRLSIWLSLILEYPSVLTVYRRHRADGFFAFGAKPASFRRLSEHEATKRLLALRRTPASSPGAAAFGSTLRFVADGAVLPTYLPVEEGAAAALGALSLAAADLYELRTGRAQEVEVRQTAAGLMTASYLYFYAQPSGQWGGCHGFDQTIAAEGSVKPQRKAYECADGRHIFLHGGFPKLKKGLTDFLQCECTVAQMSEKVARWNADELERAMQAKGLCATKCRTPMEWRASPQGQVVLGLREIEFRRWRGRGGARALPSRAARPLSDVVVIDFSHVIASPVVGRTLADHGATVVKVISHTRPRRELFDAETNHGKRTLTVELSTAEGRQRLWDWLKVADVVIDGYSEGVLDRFGFSMDRVIKANPHLVYLKSSCFGHVGPLSHGKGFQQNANFATGVASIEDEHLLGYQLVSQIDYATGFLGAYGVILALIDRQIAAMEGKAFGGLAVYASLCQTATWMMRLGADCPGFFNYVYRVTRLLWRGDRHAVSIGDLRYIPLQAAVGMSITPPLRHGFERWWPDDSPTEDLVPVKTSA